MTCVSALTMILLVAGFSYIQCCYGPFCVYRTPAPTNCPAHWIPRHGKCYKFIERRKTFDAASAYCYSIGAKLAEPTTFLANIFMQNRMVVPYTRSQRTNWWFGLTDRGVEGRWVWASNGVSPTYFDWYHTQPNQGRRSNCGAYWSQYFFKWVDEPCSRRYNFVCEKV